MRLQWLQGDRVIVDVRKSDLYLYLYICIYILIFMLHAVIVLYCERVAEGVRKSTLYNIKIPLTLRKSNTKIVLED